MASWLVHSPPGRAVQVRALARDIAFRFKTLYSHSASLHPDVEMGTGECNARGNPGMNLPPGGSRNTATKTGVERRPDGPLGPFVFL